MKKPILLIAFVLFALPMIAFGQDIIVTRNFTGLWDQPQHESQGINLQIIEQAGGAKMAVAYWYTYGNDMQSAWFMGVGPASGNQLNLVLFEGSGIGFLEGNSPGDDQVHQVGTMQVAFSSCDDGDVTFSTQIAAVGSGSFSIEKLTDNFRTECSGGISDDTPPNVLGTEQRIALRPARSGSLASGHADFEERADRTEFKVEAEDLPNGSYRIFVGGVDRGGLSVSLGRGETEFRSPVEPGKILLTFDPRGQVIEVRDSQGAILTSGDAVIDPGNNGGNNGGGGNIDFGIGEIEVDFSNTGVYPQASGDVRLRARTDRVDFNVEIEDVPVGSYGLNVGGVNVGTIQVAVLQDGSVEGELEYRDPVEPGKILLDFDPRGKQINILDGSTVILQTSFPAN